MNEDWIENLVACLKEALGGVLSYREWMAIEPHEGCIERKGKNEKVMTK